MKLVVGLGNPRQEYYETRHNAGRILVAKLQAGRAPKNVLLEKSAVFMNESGSFVADLVKKHKLDTPDLFIIHDDLDIPLGSYKIQFAKGPKVHNGLTDIYHKLGTKDFWHVRIGVDARPPEDRTQGDVYVLQEFSPEEKIILDKTLDEACKKLNNLLK
jgi:PTH1 family peptidyl-tRNA hydrolase